MGALVQGTGLGKRFRRGPEEIWPFRGLDLTVGSGAFVALLGPSGTGKTTLLHCLAGLERPDEGRLQVGAVELGGLRGAARDRWRARTVGLVFQSFHLVGVCTAQENVALGLVEHGCSRTEAMRRAAACCEELGLGDRLKHRPAQLSGGQQQRVALARALVGDPPLLLCDEPTGNLDAASGAQVLELIRERVRQRGTTVVLVTHDARAAAAADQCLHLDKAGLRVIDPAQEALAG